eukprot:gene15142-21202_t
MSLAFGPSSRVLDASSAHAEHRGAAAKVDGPVTGPPPLPWDMHPQPPNACPPPCPPSTTTAYAHQHPPPVPNAKPLKRHSNTLQHSTATSYAHQHPPPVPNAKPLKRHSNTLQHSNSLCTPAPPSRAQRQASETAQQHTAEHLGSSCQVPCDHVALSPPPPVPLLLSPIASRKSMPGSHALMDLSSSFDDLPPVPATASRVVTQSARCSGAWGGGDVLAGANFLLPHQQQQPKSVAKLVAALMGGPKPWNEKQPKNVDKLMAALMGGPKPWNEKQPRNVDKLVAALMGGPKPWNEKQPKNVDKLMAALMGGPKPWNEKVDADVELLNELTQLFQSHSEGGKGGHLGPEVSKLAPKFAELMEDSHHKVAYSSLDCFCAGVACCPAAFEPSVERTMHVLFMRVVDQKDAVRNLAISALSVCSAVFSADLVLAGLVRSMEACKTPKVRSVVMEFGATQLGHGRAAGAPTNHAHLRQWLARVVPLMGDKNADIKKRASEAVEAVYCHIDADAVLSYAGLATAAELVHLKRLISCIHEQLNHNQMREGEGGEAAVSGGDAERPGESDVNQGLGPLPERAGAGGHAALSHSQYLNPAAAAAAGAYSSASGLTQPMACDDDVEMMDASSPARALPGQAQEHPTAVVGAEAAAALAAAAPALPQAPSNGAVPAMADFQFQLAQPSALGSPAVFPRSQTGAPSPHPSLPPVPSHQGMALSPSLISRTIALNPRTPPQGLRPPPPRSDVDLAAASRQILLLTHRLQATPTEDTLLKLQEAVQASYPAEVWEPSASPLVAAAAAGLRDDPSQSVRESLATLLGLLAAQCPAALVKSGLGGSTPLEGLVTSLLRACTDSAREVVMAAKLALDLVVDCDPLRSRVVGILLARMHVTMALMGGSAVVGTEAEGDQKSLHGHELYAIVRSLQLAVQRLPMAEIESRDIRPLLMQAFNDARADVRKAVVFTLVELWMALGDDRFQPYLASMTTTQEKLVTHYYGKAQQNNGM